MFENKYKNRLEGRNIMKIIGIVQARMSSTRLPGKTLRELYNSRTTLEYTINRISKSKYMDDIIVATSIDKSDDILEEFCKRKNIKIYRGSLDDVLSRYFHIAKQNNADHIVRITADCPFIDYKLNDQLIDLYFEEKLDYAGVDQSFVARGISTEVFSMDSLITAFNRADGVHREHVTSYLYMQPEFFKCMRLIPSESYQDSRNFRLTLDTIEDLELIKKILNNIDSEYITIEEICKYLNSNKEIAKINSLVRQKSLEE